MDRRLIIRAGLLIALWLGLLVTPALGNGGQVLVYLPLVLRPAQPGHCLPGPSNSPTWEGGAVHVAPSGMMGQSFTTTGSWLCSVDVSILTAGPGSGGDTLTLTVLSDADVELATASEYVSEGYDGWLRFQLPGSGISVMPGESVVITLQDTGKGVFHWRYASDTYAGGSAIFFGTPKPGRDFFFRINF